jgi:sulfonate transport system substrate-binding protein
MLSGYKIREKKNKIISFTVAIISVVIAMAFSVQAVAADKRPLVHFGSSAGESGTLIGLAGVARELGYIQEELGAAGYDVEFLGFANGVAVNEAFLTKNLEISTLGDVPAAIGFSNKIGTVWLALGLNTCNNEILVAKNSAISSVSDLKGKKLGLGIGTSSQYLWESAVAYFNLGTDDVEVVNIPSSANGAAALLTGDVDAIVSNELLAGARLIAAGDAKSILNTAEYPQWAPLDTVVGRKDYLDAHPEVGVAVLKALIRAWEEIKINPDKYYVTISARQLEEYPDVAEKVINVDGGKFLNLDPHINEDNIVREQALADFLESVDKINGHVIVRDFVDNSYWEKAKAELGVKK